MAKITIKNENVTFEMPDNTRLLPYLMSNSAFPGGCEDGSSTICTCVILHGEDNLNAKTQAEITTLANAGLPNSKKNRLACQVIVLKGEIELEY